MGQLTNARLKLAGLLIIAAALIVAPKWFRYGGGEVQEPAKRKPMPRFSYPTLAGNTWSLEEHRGKVVFVNFWATWCGPCREETPDLVRVYEAYRDKGVEFAAISMDEDPEEAAPGFIQQYRVNYPVLVPPVDAVLTNAIQSIPTSFLVDASGKIARTWVGAVAEDDLSSAIDKVLAEGSS